MLSARDLSFVRYADDCNIYVKSTVARPTECHFLGFSLNRNEAGKIEIDLSQRSKTRLRERVKELTPRNLGATMKSAITKMNEYLQGWTGFFGICTEVVERFLHGTDAHIRRRLRAMTLKQWKRKRTMQRRLVKLGANKRSVSKQLYNGRKGLWELSHVAAVDRALNKAYWQNQGLQSVALLWKVSTVRATFSAPKQMRLCLG
jgi:RNA-directed DNA polymerase